MPRNRFEPMKAHVQSPDIATLQKWFGDGLELWVTDKFDGIRCCVLEHGPITRSGKTIPNFHVDRLIREYVPPGFDGEITVPGAFGDVQSAVMSKYGEPPFTFHVFDDFMYPENMYSERIQRYLNYASTPKHSDALFMQFEKPRVVRSHLELDEEHEKAIARGNEGLILRVPWGPYKFGRSTLNEAYMLKLKTWEDAEAIIIGFEPLFRNLNPAELDAFGRQKRASGIEGKVPDAMLGAFVCWSERFGEFRVGGPFTVLQRCNFWNEAVHMVLNRTQLTFRYQPHGTKEKPRSPQFKWIRLD